MSYSLNSLRADFLGEYTGEYKRVIKGETRSRDYSLYNSWLKTYMGFSLWSYS